MPEYKRGDLFKAPGIHIVSACSCISQDGNLTMGLGASYSMKCAYPDAPRIFGEMITRYCGHLGAYGFLVYGDMGILQNKRNYKDGIDAELILYGLRMIFVRADGSPDTIFNVTHPGLGFDRLAVPRIEAMLKNLPPNVHIWKRS